MKNSIRNFISLSLLLFVGFCVYRALPGISVPSLDSPVHASVDRVSATHTAQPIKPNTRPIEHLRVGDRVLAHNPEVSNSERATLSEPDWSQWRKLTVEMPKEDGSTLHVEIIRPLEWVESQIGFVVTERSEPICHIGPESATREVSDSLRDRPLVPPFVIVGLTVELDLAEMGAVGTGIVTAVTECPEVTTGEGQVVTATFRHPPSTGVLDVWFENETLRTTSVSLAGNVANIDRASATATWGAPVGVTDNHLFWSVDRQEFVPIGEMEIDERVQTYHGETKRIASKLARPGPPEEVYNLEVYGEHVYFVGESALLAHNMYIDEADAARLSVRSVDELDGFKLSGNRNPARSVQANKDAGDAVRDLIAIREAQANPLARITREESFRVGANQLERRLDVFVNGSRQVGIESKVGTTGLTKPVRQQIARDLRILRRGEADEIIWEFSKSQVTGGVGPTSNLAQVLQKYRSLGISIRVN